MEDIPEDISSYLRSVEPDKSWVLKDTVVQTFENVEKKIKSDSIQATKSLDKILSNIDDVSANTVETTRLIEGWNEDRISFSMISMMVYVIDKFGYNEKKYKSLADSLLIAGVLADIQNDLPYHNNLHYKKVVLHALRMITAHNHLFKDTGNILDHSAIAQLIIGACIHDLGHEGKSNIIDRKYHMAMTEKKSFDLAYPYLKSTGLDDDMLSDIRVMLITTDVSPFGDPISPVNQARSAYEYHFGMDSSDDLELADELGVLKEDDKLCLLCVMLHEADIMNSAGVDYDITCSESVSVSKEMGESGAYPENTLLFLDKICNNNMLSDSARFLADGNLIAIKSRVMDDFKNGNKPYSVNSIAKAVNS